MGSGRFFDPARPPDHARSAASTAGWVSRAASPPGARSLTLILG